MAAHVQNALVLVAALAFLALTVAESPEQQQFTPYVTKVDCRPARKGRRSDLNQPAFTLRVALAGCKPGKKVAIARAEAAGTAAWGYSGCKDYISSGLSHTNDVVWDRCDVQSGTAAVRVAVDDCEAERFIAVLSAPFRRQQCMVSETAALGALRGVSFALSMRSADAAEDRYQLLNGPGLGKKRLRKMAAALVNMAAGDGSVPESGDGVEVDVLLTRPDDDDAGFSLASSAGRRLSLLQAADAPDGLEDIIVAFNVPTGDAKKLWLALKKFAAMFDKSLPNSYAKGGGVRNKVKATIEKDFGIPFKLARSLVADSVDYWRESSFDEALALALAQAQPHNGLVDACGERLFGMEGGGIAMTGYCENGLNGPSRWEADGLFPLCYKTLQPSDPADTIAGYFSHDRYQFAVTTAGEFLGSPWENMDYNTYVGDIYYAKYGESDYRTLEDFASMGPFKKVVSTSYAMLTCGILESDGRMWCFHPSGGCSGSCNIPPGTTPETTVVDLVGFSANSVAVIFEDKHVEIASAAISKASASARAEVGHLNYMPEFACVEKIFTQHQPFNDKFFGVTCDGKGFVAGSMDSPSTDFPVVGPPCFFSGECVDRLTGEVIILSETVLMPTIDNELLVFFARHDAGPEAQRTAVHAMREESFGWLDTFDRTAMIISDVKEWAAPNFYGHCMVVKHADDSIDVFGHPSTFTPYDKRNKSTYDWQGNNYDDTSDPAFAQPCHHAKNAQEYAAWKASGEASNVGFMMATRSKDNFGAVMWQDKSTLKLKAVFPIQLGESGPTEKSDVNNAFAILPQDSSTQTSYNQQFGKWPATLAKLESQEIASCGMTVYAIIGACLMEDGEFVIWGSVSNGGDLGEAIFKPSWTPDGASETVGETIQKHGVEYMNVVDGHLFVFTKNGEAFPIGFGGFFNGQEDEDRQDYGGDISNLRDAIPAGHKAICVFENLSGSSRNHAIGFAPV